MLTKMHLNNSPIHSSVKNLHQLTTVYNNRQKLSITLFV